MSNELGVKDHQHRAWKHADKANEFKQGLPDTDRGRFLEVSLQSPLVILISSLRYHHSHFDLYWQMEIR